MKIVIGYYDKDNKLYHIEESPIGVTCIKIEKPFYPVIQKRYNGNTEGYINEINDYLFERLKYMYITVVEDDYKIDVTAI